MELELLSWLISEKWIIYWLFVFIIVGFIRKWIPYILTKFEQANQNFINTLNAQQENFNKAMREQQDTFKDTLKTISEDFVRKIEGSEIWHQNHNQKLESIVELLKK